MELSHMLERCRRIEERVAAVYRAYAAATRADPSLCALWTSLARDEEDHAHGIALARLRLEAESGRQTRIEGWEGALGEIEQRLAVAERIGARASVAQQLSAALDLEMTELEALRHLLLAASDHSELDATVAHAERLADVAAGLVDDPQVRLQAALIRARARLEHRP